MDYNPLSKKLKALDAKLLELKQSERELTKELEWYKHFSPEAQEDKRQKSLSTIQKHHALLEDIHAETLAVTNEIKQHQDSIQDIDEILESFDTNWYKDLDQETLGKLRCYYPEIDDKRAQADITNKKMLCDISNSEARIFSLMKNMRTVCNPLNWFKSDQVQLRNECNDLKNKILDCKERRVWLRKQLNELNPKARYRDAQVEHQRCIDSLQDEIKKNETGKILWKQGIFSKEQFIKDLAAVSNKYNNFDFKEKARNQKEMHNEITFFEKERERLAEKKKNNDEKINPIINEIKRLEDRIKKTKDKIQKATEFAKALSNEPNSYERFKLHRKYETEFGFEKPGPGALVRRESKKLAAMEKSLSMEKRRLAQINRKVL
ncbi:MAG: hypothetical protein WC959_01550 [Kiritimatiellales bacterium]